MSRDNLKTFTGRSLEDLTIDNILGGDLTAEDFRISVETLHEQARVAEENGYRQLAENFRRAAELCRISNEEVLQIYNQLRPGRSNYRSLMALADRLEDDYGASLNAAFVREAAEVYRKRGIVEEKND